MEKINIVEYLEERILKIRKDAIIGLIHGGRAEELDDLLSKIKSGEIVMPEKKG